MAKKKRFVFLTDEFYNAYPAADFPEIEQKKYRPYIQVCVEIAGIQYAIPLRSDIHHSHVLWTDKENNCGVDFSKAVVISPMNQILVRYSTLQYFEKEIGIQAERNQASYDDI